MIILYLLLLTLAAAQELPKHFGHQEGDLAQKGQLFDGGLIEDVSRTQGGLNGLRMAGWEARKWNWGTVPEGCLGLAVGYEACGGYDMETWEVFFDDVGLVFGLGCGV